MCPQGRTQSAPGQFPIMFCCVFNAAGWCVTVTLHSQPLYIWKGWPWNPMPREMFPFSLKVRLSDLLRPYLPDSGLWGAVGRMGWGGEDRISGTPRAPSVLCTFPMPIRASSPNGLRWSCPKVGTVGVMSAALRVPLDGGSVLEGGSPGAALWGPTKGKGEEGGRAVWRGAQGRGLGADLELGTTASQLGGLKPAVMQLKGSSMACWSRWRGAVGSLRRGLCVLRQIGKWPQGPPMLVLQETALGAP